MKKLIAVIDDAPDVLEIVSIHLGEAGYTVNEFSDAGSFLMSLKIRTPDLIILDLKLPDADGLEICKLLKKDKKFSRIPIYFKDAAYFYSIYLILFFSSP